MAETSKQRQVVDLLKAQTLSTMNTMGGPDVVVLGLHELHKRSGVVVIVREGVVLSPADLIDLSEQLLSTANMLLKTAKAQLNPKEVQPEAKDGEEAPAAGVHETGPATAVGDRVDGRGAAKSRRPA